MEVEDIKKYSKQLYNKLKSKKYGKRFVYDTDNKTYLTFGSDKLLVNITDKNNYNCMDAFSKLFDFEDTYKTKKFTAFKNELSKIKKDITFKDYTMLELQGDKFIPTLRPTFNYKVIEYKYLDTLRLFISKFKPKDFKIIVNEASSPLEIMLKHNGIDVRIAISEVMLKN